LLLKRYEAIALYPDCQHEIGDIFIQDENLRNFVIFKKTSLLRVLFSIELIQKYNHLFRELTIFDYRQPEEMPKYLKSPDVNGNISYKEVNYWFLDCHIDCNYEILFVGDIVKYWGRKYTFLNNNTPISEDEFMAEISKNKC
jgi:hypothetical protein